MPLARYRIAKHRSTYEQHLVDVLLRQDQETAALLRCNDALERRITTELEPAVALRRRELDALRARAAAPVTDSAVHDLEAALNAAGAEIAALRNSASWRVTAPLRGIYGWWLRARGAP